MKSRKIELNEMEIKNKETWITLIDLVITILVSYDEKINSRIYRNVERNDDNVDRNVERKISRTI